MVKLSSLHISQPVSCVKCALPGEYSAVNSKKSIYCQLCFLKMVRHKFDYALGNNRIFCNANPTKALLVIEPYIHGPASALLLSLFCQALSEKTAKRLRAIPSILILLTSSNAKDKKTFEAIQEIQKYLKSYDQNWTFYCVHLAAVLEKNLELIKDNTEDICSLIANLTAFVDLRFTEVQIVRPLRNVNEKEINIYHTIQGTTKLYPLLEHQESKDLFGNGIQPICSAYINNLQNNGFPSTMETILSISSKVDSKQKKGFKCEICFADFSKTNLDDNLCYPCQNLFVEISDEIKEKITSIFRL